MKHKVQAVSIGLCILVLSACMKQIDYTDIIISDFKRILTIQDERLQLYEGALNVVRLYVDDPASERLIIAQAACTDAITRLLELEEIASELDDKAKDEMVALSIDITDYKVPFLMQSYYKSNNIQTIMYLLYFLNEAPTLNEQLKYVVEFNLQYESMERKIDLLALNGLFVNLPEKATEDLRANFLPGLKALGTDNLPWETDKTIIESKANSLFLDMEKEILEYSDFVGKQYTDALVLQQACETALINNGIKDTEAVRLLEEINQLSEKSQKEQMEMLEGLPNSE